MAIFNFFFFCDLNCTINIKSLDFWPEKQSWTGPQQGKDFGSTQFSLVQLGEGRKKERIEREGQGWSNRKWIENSKEESGVWSLAAAALIQ